MPEMTVKYSREELEHMIVELLLRPQGLRLAPAEKPIVWKTRPTFKVIIHAEVDPTATAAVPEPKEPERDPLEEVAAAPEVELDPRAFPPGTNLAALKDAMRTEQQMNKRPMMPGESFERKKQ